MVVIPAGSFMMGSPESEAGRTPAEGPQRQVTIRTFAIGKYDVTRAQWVEFVTATNRPVVAGCEWAGFPHTEEDMLKTSWRNLGFLQEDNHPAVCVSWNDAQNYLRWLSQKMGQRYRLPTEAEWEYTARAGTQTPYPWGASPWLQRDNPADGLD
jgi:formylglycine-generating enzyme required for sulfatase activity